MIFAIALGKIKEDNTQLCASEKPVYTTVIRNEPICLTTRQILSRSWKRLPGTTVGSNASNVNNVMQDTRTVETRAEFRHRLLQWRITLLKYRNDVVRTHNT